MDRDVHGDKPRTPAGARNIASMAADRPAMTAGPRPVRVLIVDDCADDAELVQLEFAAQGVAAECHCVDTRAKLVAALDAFTPDVVLSDVNLPGFSAHEACACVRDRLPQVPILLLSGAFPEGDALPAADALLTKGEFTRLPGLVLDLVHPAPGQIPL